MDLSKAEWFKATSSTGSNGACVEVAILGDQTGLRDSKRPEDGAHVVDRDVFAAFLADIKAGLYDL